MPAFSTSLSGLSAASEALSVIGNNLANLNTTAFKESTVAFKDLFYQQLGTTGSGNPIQVGVGAGVGAILQKATQGSVQTTGVPTDVAIQGQGYFSVKTSAGTEYTRNGNFSVNSSGQLITADGGLVLGYPASGGVVNTNQAPGALAVAGGTLSPPNATTGAQIAMNLDSTTAVGGTFSTSMSVYDSLGASHVLTYNFTKTASNAWDYSITIPGSEVGASTATSQVAKGSLTFDGAGKLTAPAADVTGLNIKGFANGASDMTFNWNLLKSGSPTVTQLANTSATASTTQDGYSSGALTGFNVLSDGTIEGQFSNGQSLALGQLALANFSNTQGLQQTGSGNYLATLSSGTADVGISGTAGRGTVAGGALEQSNVDIATEFSNLILAQRGFQANAKAITTLDQVTQDAINMKQ